jgi:hypothetical protein
MIPGPLVVGGSEKVLVSFDDRVVRGHDFAFVQEHRVTVHVSGERGERTEPVGLAGRRRPRRHYFTSR